MINTKIFIVGPGVLAVVFALIMLLGHRHGVADDHDTQGSLSNNSLPDNVTYTTYKNWPIIGKTTLKWLWLAIYDATLHTPSGQYRAEQWPLALALTYKRDIKAEDLVESTEEQWQRLKLDYQTDWLKALKVIWPNVKKGDELMLAVDEQENAWFFYNSEYIGGIEANSNLSLQFANAFSQIWLSEQALVPKSRNELIGEAND